MLSKMLSRHHFWPEQACHAAEAAVEKQGQLVRDLKETHGKANSDPEVKEAVSELLRLKQELEQLT